MTHRSRNLAVVLGALTAAACSVYSISDLPPLEGKGGGSSAGKGGSAGGGGTAGGISGGTSSGAGNAGEAGQGDAGGESGGAPSGGTVGGGGKASGGSGGTLGSGGTAGNVTSGGSTGGVTAKGGAPSSGGAPPAAPPELIDNMEDTNGQVFLHEGRDGYWYTSADTAGSSVDPPQGKSIPMAMFPMGETGAAGGSSYAFHFTGKAAPSGTPAVWGALGGVDLHVTTLSGSTQVKRPYDASAYRGIRFWAKAASALNIAVRLPIRDTTHGAVEAKCDPSACEDHWSKNEMFTTTWALHTMLWPDGSNKMGWTQASWGYQTAFDPATLVGIQFLIPPGFSADIWIDDLSFVP
ncbi:MAG: hypothetical protein ACOY0T_40490 [Myxococcota bacterium]